jgi:glycosyltransferase involved in cell wall biosynthesis
MPVYNAMPYLEEAVHSITSQTFEDFSLLIVDDGSTDGSLAFLKTLTDRRVSIIPSSIRGGQGAARNLALAQCETEYTAFMDADDVSLQTRLEKQVEFLDENRAIGFVGTRILYMGESGRRGFSPPLSLTQSEIRIDLLRQRHALVNATLMFRTKLLKACGGFRIYGAGEDWDLFLRMTELCRVANLDEILYLYRVHKGKTTTVQAEHVRLRYAHACECARVRCEGGVEKNFSDFCERQRTRPLWKRWAEQLDECASSIYREALQYILNGCPLKGYARLMLAAMLSPKRLAQRVQRAVRAARRS